jgi:hypothetical protein
MFFRNQKPHEWTLAERLSDLKPFHFEVKPQAGGALVARGMCAALLEASG